jgi:hypothetical protein
MISEGGKYSQKITKDTKVDIITWEFIVLFCLPGSFGPVKETKTIVFVLLVIFCEYLLAGNCRENEEREPQISQI